MRTAMNKSKLFVVSEPLDPELELTRFIGEWMHRYGSQPTFLFSQVKGFPLFKVVMNLLKRPLLLQSLQAPLEEYLPVLSERLRQGHADVRIARSPATERLTGLEQVPVMRHQPGDVGRYFTSAITCLHNPDTGVHNLGFYRALVKGPRRCVIFMDPRTDAHRILQGQWARGRTEVPITLHVGGPPSLYLGAAASVPYDEDSHVFASRLSGSTILLDEGPGGYPPAPVEAEFVIRGRILREEDEEAPFGEFKGYYCAPTRSPVLEVDEVHCRPDAYFLGLFCGKESGLTLMSLQNELLMYHRLRARGFVVEDVRNPLGAFGEFLTLIQTPEPGREMLEAAMEMDKRSKMVVVVQDIQRVLAELAVHDFDVLPAAYIKRGQQKGDRLGLVVRRTEQLRWVEY
ncbi:UbiD family decarboxylase [Cystobacter fuscus]